MTDDRSSNHPSPSAARAALEALFAPKTPTPAAAAKRDSAKMLVGARVAASDADPERAKLLERFMRAEGRAAITKAADALERRGHAPPEDQATQLQLLEHADEDRVRAALESLARLLDREAPARHTLLEARLRRIEELAEDAATRALASALRRRVRR